MPTRFLLQICEDKGFLHLGRCVKKDTCPLSWGDSCIRGGQALPRYGMQGRLRFTVGRGPVPRRAIGRGKGLGLRAFFAEVERSRGTGPRATVCQAVSFHRRARACPSPCLGQRKALVCVRFSRGSGARGGQAPALRYARRPPFHRRARACPSPCLGRNEKGLCLRSFFARVERSRGTGPRATVCQAVSFHRRARACPSPCLGRENGLCLRSFFARVERSRGTGPRATVCKRFSLRFPFSLALNHNF